MSWKFFVLSSFKGLYEYMYALNYEYHCFYHVHQQIVSETARQPQDTEVLILTPWVDQSLTRGHVKQASFTPL